MDAIILAAGRGSRLMPYTKNSPKCLTEISRKPLLHWQIEALQSSGVKNIIIVIGYLGNQIRKATQGYSNIFLINNPNWAETNMVESLMSAQSFFCDDFIVSYSDIIYQLSVLEYLTVADSEIMVAVDTGWKHYWASRFYNPLSDAESLRISGADQIIQIGDKVSVLDEIEAQYIGLLRFKGEGVNELVLAHQELGNVGRHWMNNRKVKQAHMTDLLMEMILRGFPVTAVKIFRSWLEIDTPDDLRLAIKLIKEPSWSQQDAVQTKVHAL